MRNLGSPALAVLILSLGLIAHGAAGLQDEPSAGDPEIPAFRDEAGTTAFTEGRELFDSGDFKGAEKAFKTARKSVEKTSKRLLDAWVQACKGGTQLARVEKAVAGEKWRTAWGQLAKVRATYGATPLRSRIEALAGRISEELFLALATFEEPPPEPEKKAGTRPESSELVTDPERVREGERSLRWRESVGLGARRLIGILTLADFGGGVLQDYRALHISIYSEDKDTGKFTVFFDTGELNENPLEILKSNCYYHHLTVNHVGWKDYRIDLDREVSSLTKPMKEEITRLNLLMIPPSKPKTIWIDDVKLEKR